MQAAIGATATGPTCPTAQRAAPARASVASAGLRPASLPDARRFLSGVQLLRTRASARRNAASRRTIVKAAAEGADQLNAMFEGGGAGGSSKIFGPPQQMDALQGVVSGLSTPIMYAVGGVLVAAGLGAGASVGAKAMPESKTIGQAAGAVVLGAGAAVGAKVLNDKRKTCAPVAVQNLLVSRGDDPTVTVAEVDAIGEKYGTNVRSEFGYEMGILYDAYMQSVLPGNDEPLVGDEHLKLMAFKDGLGLEDGDAASVHIEAGRRIFRSRMEVGRDGQKAEHKAFQKLVFVSNMVFGEAKSKFLTPWKRLFDVTDASLAVSRRDMARGLYQKKMDDLPGECEADEAQLKSLRAVQTTLGLEDGVAAECLATAARKRIEGNFDRAIEQVKTRGKTKDPQAVLAELEAVLAYNRSMESLAGVEGIAAGVGPVTLFGGKLAVETSEKDLKELYKMYLGDAIKDGKFEETTVANLAALRTTMMMGPTEADKITADVTAVAYRNALRKAVQDGTLDGAESKAQYLQTLCNDLKFPPQSAAEVHEDIYRTRLETNLEDKVLTDKDAEQLNRLRVLLCVPNNVVKKAHEDIAGAIYKDALQTAMSVGVDAFSFKDREALKKAKANLRLDSDVCVKMLTEASKMNMMGYITKARNAANRVDGAKEIKKMIFFNTQVVTPLLEDAKPPKTPEEIEKEKKDATAKLEFEKLMKEAQEMADKEDKEKAEGAEAKAEGADGEEETKGEDKAEEEEKKEEEKKEEEKKVEDNLTKATKAKELEEAASIVGGATGMQKEITLAGDLDLEDRQGIYKNFLLYCMTGDVKQLPMGGQIVVERDQSEFARLSQLGDVLGLSQVDVADVHSGLSEQAFRSNVENVMRDGIMSEEKMKYMKGLQKQLGMTDEAAQKVISGVTSQRMMGTVGTQISQGTLTMKEIKELKATGVDVNQLVSADTRASLYRKEVETMVSNGSGPFDFDKVLEESVTDLELEESRARGVLSSVAKEKKRGSLVTAISFLRQKDREGCQKNINNLLACHSGAPDVPIDWTVEEELMDLFSVYCLEEKDAEKQGVLADCLGFDAETTKGLQEAVESGGFHFGSEAENVEEALF